MKIWNRIPAIIRGIIIGMAIQIIGVMPLFLIIQKNIEILPTFPWALLIGGLLLYLFWRFFSGKRRPFPASEKRADLSRTKKLQPKAIATMMISGFIFSVTLLAFVFIGYMLTEVPLNQVELLTALKGIPVWSSLSLLFLASVTTGVVEEMAWRGYAQRIIEKKHSPVLAICIVALVFTIIHFLPFAIWPLFFLGSLGWGFLAYYSNSIVPGIIYHTLVDLIAFVWALYNLETLEFILSYNIFEDGLNTMFKILVAIAVPGTLLTILSLRKLKKLEVYKMS